MKQIPTDYINKKIRAYLDSSKEYIRKEYGFEKNELEKENERLFLVYPVYKKPHWYLALAGSSHDLDQKCRQVTEDGSVCRNPDHRKNVSDNTDLSPVYRLLAIKVPTDVTYKNSWGLSPPSTTCEEDYNH